MEYLPHTPAQLLLTTAASLLLGATAGLFYLAFTRQLPDPINDRLTEHDFLPALNYADLPVMIYDEAMDHQPPLPHSQETQP